MHPNMGWRPGLWHPKLKQLRVFRVKIFERILILYLPLPDGVDILRVVHGSRNMRAFIQREGL
jgi:toxin ParE1/3/4